MYKKESIAKGVSRCVPGLRCVPSKLCAAGHPIGLSGMTETRISINRKGQKKGRKGDI